MTLSIISNKKSLSKHLEDKKIFMIIGNGSNNQFKNMKDIHGVVSKISDQIPINSTMLYFGDAPNEKNPDIGYVFQLLSKKRKDLEFFMIQIKAAKNWGVPQFVSNVYWHNTPKNDNKQIVWGGIDDYGNPLSNTKIWYDLHKNNKNVNISNVFILSGGPITLQEFTLIKSLDIPFQYFPLERTFKGDGKTLIKKTDSLKMKIGDTYKQIISSNLMSS